MKARVMKKHASKLTAMRKRCQQRAWDRHDRLSRLVWLGWYTCDCGAPLDPSIPHSMCRACFDSCEPCPESDRA